MSRRRFCHDTRSSLKQVHKRQFGGDFLKFLTHPESNQNRARVNWIRSVFVICWIVDVDALLTHRTRNDRPYCVLATRGGTGVVMNWVASSIAGPSGVGIFSQNGARIRVPASGANAISMLRWAVRYLITGRSGI